MPLFGPPLSQSDIDFIRQWVENGALPDSLNAVALAPRAVSASVKQDVVLDSMPNRVTIVWSSPIDSSTFSDSTVSLRRNNIGENNDVQTAIDVSVVTQDNPFVTTLLINDPAAIAGDFQLRIAGEGDIPARAIDARAIDGDGDGVEGGNFVLDFSIAQP